MIAKILNGFEMARFTTEDETQIDCENNAEDNRLCVYVAGLRHYIYSDGSVDTERVSGTTWDGETLTDEPRQVPEATIVCDE